MTDYNKFKRLNKEYRNQKRVRLELVNEFLSNFGIEIKKKKKSKKNNNATSRI